MLIFLRRYAVPFFLSFICILTWILGEQATVWLNYQRSEVDNGQFWRLLTANIVHLGGWHTLLNLASLWLISFIFLPLLTRAHWMLWFFVLFIANILAMHLWLPDLSNYVGMSGALYGLIAACAVAEFRLGVKISGILLVLVGLKIFAPQLLGVVAEYDSWLGGTVVEESHIIGYIQGLILGLVWPKKLIQQTALAESIGYGKEKKGQ